ncbi:MAG: VOC family protein [Anaerovibrio sp.]|uniref:VOC family protein n=1 Tax=Anaerovibrio sp. TaxID=1872532 RepID=UPI0025F0B632|nr:VOC family protein [Anaerovibrio sp.]MCR5176746.1 VOC family protein [Anaerovibrio sp.]
MKFSIVHNSLTVQNLERSIEFYQKALGMKVKGRKDLPELTLVYMGDAADSRHELELTLRQGHDGSYDLGDNPVHLAFEVDDYDAALQLHRAMNCVVRVVEGSRIYFISDPDGYHSEIMSKS